MSKYAEALRYLSIGNLDGKVSNESLWSIEELANFELPYINPREFLDIIEKYAYKHYPSPLDHAIRQALEKIRRDHKDFIKKMESIEK